MTGGTGLIGRALCHVLLEKGHELTVLSRNPASVKIRCGESVQPMFGLGEWDETREFDAVINLAGEPIVDARWSASRKNALWDSRVGLTQQLVDCIRRAKHKPKVLLSGSAVGYYGDRGDEILDESSSGAADYAAKLCDSWECAAQQAASFGVRVCLLRTGLVLSKDGGLMGRMLTPFKLGLGARLGTGSQWMSWIQIDDYIAMVLRLLISEDLTGPVDMTAPQPATNMEFTLALAGALRRPAIFVAPSCLLKAALGERAPMLLGGQRVLPCKMTAHGYQFMHPQLISALRTEIDKRA